MKIKFINNYIKKGTDIAKSHGIAIFFKRLLIFFVSRFRVFLHRKKLNTKKWHDIKDSKSGDTIFILGNGPSLNLTPLYLLKNQDVFCFNGFHHMLNRINWTPKYYMVTDDLVAFDLRYDIPNMVKKVDKAFFPLIHPSNKPFYKFIKDEDNIFWLDAGYPDFRRDLPKCGINNTVINAAIQIAIYMGYKNICFLGVDLSYDNQTVKKETLRNWIADEDDINHFDSKYFAKGKRYHDPQPDKMKERLQEAKKKFGLEVNFYNCGVGGNLDIFTRKDLQSFLKVNENDMVQMFLDETNNKVSTEELNAFINSDQNLLKINNNSSLKKLDKNAKLIANSDENKIIGPYKNIFYEEKIQK